MVSNIADLLLDLLEVAAYVYCADQQASRGSEKLTDVGSGWRRLMRFTIPVRDPDLWSSHPVADALQETLGFLSDDTYEFDFVKASRPLAEKHTYFPNLFDDSHSSDEVALFSGGLDSFAGAVEDLAVLGKRMVLVGHHSASKVFANQKELISGLRALGLTSQIVYVPVNVTNAGVKAIENTQRTRSFLFACLGFVLARMFEKDEFTFYENGVVSLNLPIAGDVLGARATRTTHPKVIRGFEAIFSSLTDRQIEIRTPLQWLTKTEVVQKIVSCGFGPLIAGTNSCTRPRTWTTAKRHCGVCSQCIDRRFAILAADAGHLDPADQYAVDLLTGDRSLDADVRMAVAYVKFFQVFASSTKSSFISDNPEITSALRFFPDLSPEQASNRIHDLYRRHADDVVRVIRDGLASNAERLARNELPAGSLLSLCLGRQQIIAAPTSDYDTQLAGFMDKLSRPVCQIAVDPESSRVWFGGQFFVEGANFNLINALLPNHRTAKASLVDVPFIEPWRLAEMLDIDEGLLRQQVSRIRRLVSERLAIEQGVVLGDDDFIENRRSEGYRLSPSIREVARADLLPA
ncbi:hypothetical protein MesoLjLb_33430 [Mesorhizobium sp. L-8-3]|nr:hypothetical protein MesoLjLb_33430 [Mesorhizobium sp. L-8-3]